jgi:hypothetical protein
VRWTVQRLRSPAQNKSSHSSLADELIALRGHKSAIKIQFSGSLIARSMSEGAESTWTRGKRRVSGLEMPHHFTDRPRTSSTIIARALFVSARLMPNVVIDSLINDTLGRLPARARIAQARARVPRRCECDQRAELSAAIRADSTKKKSKLEPPTHADQSASPDISTRARSCCCCSPHCRCREIPGCGRRRRSKKETRSKTQNPFMDRSALFTLFAFLLAAAVVVLLSSPVGLLLLLALLSFFLCFFFGKATSDTIFGFLPPRDGLLSI